MNEFLCLVIPQKLLQLFICDFKLKGVTTVLDRELSVVHFIFVTVSCC